MRFLILFLLYLAASGDAIAEEILVQTVDGLNRPLANVHIEVSCYSRDNAVTHIDLESKADGKAQGRYDAMLCKPTGVSYEKNGYGSYSSGFRSRYTLRRQFSPREVVRVVNLGGDDQRRELRELLAGDCAEDSLTCWDLVFYYESRLRPVLRDLAREPEVTERARDLLSMIAVSDDLHLIMRLPPPPSSQPPAGRWRYSVDTALVNPDAEDEWTFLTRCARNEFDDRWVDAGAIQTLMLTASARSRRILTEARQHNPSQSKRISRALAWIDSNPAPLVDADLNALANRVAQAIRIGDWLGNGSPRLNAGKDKALVDIKFHAGFDQLVYTATFHKLGESWILRGVHETLQQFAPPAPPPPKP